MSDPDYWGWVEPDAGAGGIEPGLYAFQTRPQLATGQIPKVIVATFVTEAATIAGAFGASQSVSWPVTSYETNFPVHGDGLGGWGFDKNHIVWIYDDTDIAGSGPEDTYIAVADTSARPVVLIDPDVDFTVNLTYFSISGNSLQNPSLARSVPPTSAQISFLAQTLVGTEPTSIYLIGASDPSIQGVIEPTDLLAGGSNISYYAWSPDGRYLVAKVDDRMILYNRNTSTVVLDVLAQWDPAPPQFSDDGSLLFYTYGGQLVVRREIFGFAVDETVPENGDTYTCQSNSIPFIWRYPRLSPSQNYWLNIYAETCGGAFNLTYRSFMRFFTSDFSLITSNDVSAFASGHFFGHFTNDSRWYRGGDDNINGDSRVTFGPDPDWDLEEQTGTSTAAHWMRSFQAW